MQQHKKTPNMICFVYFTPHTNLFSDKNIASHCPSATPAELYNYFQIMITLVVIVDLIYLCYLCPKTFSFLGLVKLLS